jgi:dihydrofolate synthase/folylpolyglutamate synthase
VATLELLGDRRLDDAALGRGIAAAQWPARLQRLRRGPLANALPAGWELWLDGGHNESGAATIAAWARANRAAWPVDVAVALRTTKRAAPFFAALAPAVRRIACIGNPADAVAAAPDTLAAAAREAGAREILTAPDAASGIAALAARAARPRAC